MGKKYKNRIFFSLHYIFVSFHGKAIKCSDQTVCFGISHILFSFHLLFDASKRKLFEFNNLRVDFFLENSKIMSIAKATTIKEAIKRFEDRFKINATDAKEVQLQFQWPPIERMDPNLGTLTHCEYVLKLFSGKSLNYVTKGSR